MIESMQSPKPGQNTGDKGGIFQEVGPRGGKQPNYAAVPDNKPLPPPRSGTSNKLIKYVCKN
jgi:hypothetical protein